MVGLEGAHFPNWSDQGLKRKKRVNGRCSRVHGFPLGDSHAKRYRRDVIGRMRQSSFRMSLFSCAVRVASFQPSDGAVGDPVSSFSG